MKTTILLLFLIPLSLFGQNKINEKQAIDKKHLDFNKEYLFFELSGLIEIDGHTFRNDTCADPIIFEVDLYEIRIHDKNNTYTPHKCGKPACKILHFNRNKSTSESSILKYFNDPLIYTPSKNSTLLFDQIKNPE